MKRNNTIFIIGYRATGKTTIGRLLSKEIGWKFIDTDTLVVEREKKSIKKIIEEKGWEYFRKKESSILREVCKLKKQIVATGGGIILRKENIESMKQQGKIILLKASIYTIKNRIEHDKNSKQNRPPLQKRIDITSEISKNLKKRAPLYKKAADITFDTDSLNLKEITNKIKKEFF